MAPENTDAWTGLAKQTTEQITERTQEAVTNYFNWLQNTMSAASPWSNTDLNKKSTELRYRKRHRCFGVHAATQRSQEFGGCRKNSN